MSHLLSTSVGKLAASYDVVVVGTGYGGSIVARRLAEESRNRARSGGRPFSVCVLERGLELRPGMYPTTLLEVLGQVRTESRFGPLGRKQALFDLRIQDDVTVLVGCGLGGTSLINASVMLRPESKFWPEDVLASWPKSLQRSGVLDRYFQAVERELGVRPTPDDIALDKFERLQEGGRGSEPESPAKRPPLAVSFHTHVNAFGVQQARCTLCGNCMTGCNYSAKNTLITNYLPAAVKAGASVFCGVSVSAITPNVNQRDSMPWIVHATLADKASRRFRTPDVTIRAGAVFLASGSLGSTEILLRSRESGLTSSRQLGERFSGNGDFVAFGYDLKKRVSGFGYGPHLPPFVATGPTITGMLDERGHASGAMIQEGSIPAALGGLMRFAGPVIARLCAEPPMRLSFHRIRLEVDSLLRGSHHGALARTQTYLGMGLDDQQGQMSLSGQRLRIEWPSAPKQGAIRDIGRRLKALTDALGGIYVDALRPRFFGARQLIAHPLGGCAMADTPERGVVNEHGQVFSAQNGKSTDVHPGLYVCDGAIIPTPLGTNPALTIGALAERIAEHAAQRVAMTSEADRPEAETPAGVARLDPATRVLRYGEHLSGRMCLDGVDTDVDLFLHISTSNVDELLAAIKAPADFTQPKEPPVSHPSPKDQSAATDRASTAGEEAPLFARRWLDVVGTMVAGAQGAPSSRQRFAVSEGRLGLLIDDDRFFDTKLLVYELTLTAPSGRRAYLRGHKAIDYEHCRTGLWRAATRLPFVIFNEKPKAKPQEPYAGCWAVETYEVSREIAAGAAGAGYAAGSVMDAWHLMTSLEVLHERRPTLRLFVKCRFAWTFLDALIQARFWPLRRTTMLNPLAPDVINGSPAMGEAVARIVHPLNGQTKYILTRFNNTRSGKPPGRPVVLVPGFGMSTYWYRANMAQGNLTKHLLAEGYDVWLLDYRVSNRVDASLGQFTLDEIAEQDLPEAFARVHKETGRKIQVVAHCVGSLTTLMALLSGRLSKCVHSIVLSQSMLFIDMPFVNRFKAFLRAAQVVRFLGFRPVLTTQFGLGEALATRLLDRILYFYPSHERCRSGVCRRLLLIYGEANRHAQLDRKTHDMIYDFEDSGNLTSIAQLQRMALKKKIVDAQGGDIYVTEANGKNITMPLTLLQGEKNNLFRRSGALDTREWLHRHGGDESKGWDTVKRRRYFTYVELPEHGHMDVFIGKTSTRTYEAVAKALRDMARLES